MALNVSAMKGRYSPTVAMTTMAAATNWPLMSLRVTPSTSPKSSEVTSVVNERALDTMTMPSDSMPTKRSPMPVSSRITVRADTTDTRPAMSAAATSAPMMGLKPQSTARAMPGMTPCAIASPRKASPRNTTQVPTSDVATTASRLPISARCMNAGSKASTISCTT